MGVLVLKIIGKNEYCGVSRNGKPYQLVTLELDFEGTKVKIKTFEKNAEVGDFAQVSIGTRKMFMGRNWQLLLIK